MKYHKQPEHIDFFSLYSCSAFFIVILSSFSFFTDFKKTDEPAVFSKEVVTVSPLFANSAFDAVKIEGKAYIVYDLVDHYVIASKNELDALPLASITKVMTAVSALQHKDRTASVTITPNSIEDGYDLGLRNKQVWKLSELLKYTLIFSSNDGAEAVAGSFGGHELFVKQMNQDAKDLGLVLSFTDPAGRDLNGKIGGKGTALEVAKLFSVAREKIPDILDATTKKRGTVAASSGKVSGVPNTNQIIEDLSGAEASKTGFTDMAGGNLGIIVDVSIGHPVVIVVLGSTREGRFRDVEMLYRALRKSMIPTGDLK